MIRPPPRSTRPDTLVPDTTLVRSAHWLAPLASATSRGLGRPPVKLVAPFSLGLNGNAVTLLAPLAQKLRKLGGAVDDPAATGAALARLISERPYPRLRLAVVHRFSSHNYMLRSWLAACGINPEKAVDIVVVPTDRKRAV